ncbi:MAG: isoprenylcysteine carboxylmethyltransferase family protein [Lachnospiraceae bacterium]|nr:isoprenylcysteine carboxylmethyltransferase family protein [Lachnospiraceae bacterium]
MNGEILVIGGADGPTAVFLAGTLGSLFFCAALVILAVFYGIYFAKKIAQRRRGIQTTQLGGHGKERSVRWTEYILSAATGLVVVVELISIFQGWNIMPWPVRIAGILCGGVGDLVFLAAVRTMKDSWRAGIPKSDETRFVSEGIYQYSRNPAFLGFDLVYLGILMMYFNGVLLLFTMWAVVMLHLQILQEERYLKRVFGDVYLAYKSRTRRYLGRSHAGDR